MKAVDKRQPELPGARAVEQEPAGMLALLRAAYDTRVGGAYLKGMFIALTGMCRTVHEGLGIGRFRSRHARTAGALEMSPRQFRRVQSKLERLGLLATKRTGHGLAFEIRTSPALARRSEPDADAGAADIPDRVRAMIRGGKARAYSLRQLGIDVEWDEDLLVDRFRKGEITVDDLQEKLDRMRRSGAQMPGESKSDWRSRIKKERADEERARKAYGPEYESERTG